MNKLLRIASRLAAFKWWEGLSDKAIKDIKTEMDLRAETTIDDPPWKVKVTFFDSSHGLTLGFDVYKTAVGAELSFESWHDYRLEPNDIQTLERASLSGQTLDGIRDLARDVWNDLIKPMYFDV